ncbi:AzlC family ABC transporter permease [Desulfovibrio mangrovi]|uniref:AzlC family ABC transporter permease n=1 Tax=Desulfovibrio mangrovi TaxID=2976983 RepID=UPI0022454772|nr:AzlC family ABC transporter permease [Desulfovibrio mangrovi]UZP66285.1 AzlC family ABC transporter permease [Desulfovibrio mangrovi]
MEQVITETQRRTSASGIWEGVRQALPIVMGYLPVGFAYGVLARKVGISEWNTVLMSVLVYAGSAQFIAVSLLAAAASPVSIVLTTFVVNLRHLLMSAALAPYLRNWTRLQQALFTFELTDESFALHARRFPEGRTGAAETYALNATAQLSWVAGSALGIFGSNLIGDVKPLGLDYALSAMFIALLVGQVRTNMHVVVAVLSAVMSVTFMLAGAGQWNVILATICGATAGTVLSFRNASDQSTPSADRSRS